MAGLFHYYSNILGVPLDEIRYVDCEFAFVALEGGGRFELAFGDPVTEVEKSGGRTSFTIVGGRLHGAHGSVKGDLPLRGQPILRLSMIDVQQGDGLILDTPDGNLVTIDGGDNQLFARHVAARFAGTRKDAPLNIDAMIVTHGDADHFAGLKKLVDSEKLKNSPDEPDRIKKRVFAVPAAVFHNGLVKRGGKLPGGASRKESDLLGPSKASNGELYATGLVESPLDVARADMNAPFKGWAAALDHWEERRGKLGLPAIKYHRVDQSSKALGKAVSADPDVRIEILGPVTRKIGGKAALPFFREPEKDAELHLAGADAERGAHSASHTINGHSISFKLTYRNVRMMFTGDLNQESMARLHAALPAADFEAEILKAPHHGSADFDFGFLKAVRPVVSIISSGDESRAKEYIHPRATLVSALGKASRGGTGVIFMTELAAFFAARGYAKEVGPKGPADGKPFFAFERINFGIIHIRTDGERVLAFTHSGKFGMNEAYAFAVDSDGKVTMKKALKAFKG